MGNHVWPIEWQEYQRPSVSLKVTFVVMNDETHAPSEFIIHFGDMTWS